MARIFLVDNDVTFLNTRKELLEKEGFYIISAKSIEEARARLQENQFDLAVIDIRLLDDKDSSDFTGLTLVRELSKKIPIILYSGFVRYEDINNFNLEGRIFDFLDSKDYHQMLKAIRNSLERKNIMEGRIVKKIEQARIYNIVGIAFFTFGGIAGIFGAIVGSLRLLFLTLPLIVIGSVFFIIATFRS